MFAAVGTYKLAGGVFGPECPKSAKRATASGHVFASVVPKSLPASLICDLALGLATRMFLSLALRSSRKLPGLCSISSVCPSKVRIAEVLLSTLTNEP